MPKIVPILKVQIADVIFGAKADRDRNTAIQIDKKCGEILGLTYLDREEIKIPCNWYMARAKEIFPLARAAGG